VWFFVVDRLYVFVVFVLFCEICMVFSCGCVCKNCVFLCMCFFVFLNFCVVCLCHLCVVCV